MERKSQIITPKRILFFFVLINLIAAVFIAPDYGTSTDEKLEGIRSTVALQSYFGESVQALDQSYQDMKTAQYYGTASTVLIRFVERVFFPHMDHQELVVAHYSYFVFFQLAVVGVFFLGCFFYSDWISLAVAVLFGTQPLLFGHAFINPKDIPLMTVFIFTILTGFWMVDGWQKKGNDPLASAGEDGAPRKSEWMFFGILAGIFLILWGSNTLLDLMVSLVGYQNISQGTLRWDIFVILLVLVLLFRGAHRRKLFAGRVNMALLLAAAIWGFALSTRVVAFAAGGIVGLYALIREKQKAVVPLIIYSLSAAIVSYLAWPYLWTTGLKGLWESFIQFSTFEHDSLVFFEGQWYVPSDLPARFVPKLMLLQFTEPVVILVFVGFLLGLYWLISKKLDPVKFVLLAAWFGLPLGFTMMGNSTNYNNFRQYLFIIPPLFIFCGIALQQLAYVLKKPLWIALVSAVILIPGVYNLVTLHPYQYIYYNEFTGGVKGAADQYELDYWKTAYKEMMAYINTNLPGASKVLVAGNDQQPRVYAVKRSNVVTYQALQEQDYGDFDYVIISDRNVMIHPEFSKYREVYGVYIDGVRLMALLKIP